MVVIKMTYRGCFLSSYNLTFISSISSQSDCRWLSNDNILPEYSQYLLHILMQLKHCFSLVGISFTLAISTLLLEMIMSVAVKAFNLICTILFIQSVVCNLIKYCDTCGSSLHTAFIGHLFTLVALQFDNICNQPAHRDEILFPFSLESSGLFGDFDP